MTIGGLWQGFSSDVSASIGVTREALSRALRVAAVAEDAYLAERAHVELRVRGMSPTLPKLVRRVRARRVSS